MALLKVLADSSSIILLQKAKLLEVLQQKYQIIITHHVYEELTGGGQEGSSELGNLLFDNIIHSSEDNCIDGMDQGESSILELYLSGVGDFVLLDDKKGAKYCKSHAIPFVNALLVSRILFLAGAINEAEYSAASELLIHEGYYGEMIIKKAVAIEDAELQRFMAP